MSPDPDRELTQPGIDGWRPAQPARSLLVYHHDGANLVPLAPGVPVVIGRGADADIQCRGARISRRHARFQLIEDKVLVQDLDSTNGTFVNGAPALGPTIVAVGDEVGLGSVVVSITSLNPVEAERSGIEGHDRFMARLRDEIARSATFHRPMSLVMIRELDADQAHLHRWASVIRELLRAGVDRMGLYEPRQLGVILAEAGLDAARAFCDEVRAAVDPDESPLGFGVAVYPAAGRTVDRLVATALHAVGAATYEEPVVYAGRTAGIVQARAATHEPIVVRSPAMQAVFKRVDQVARAPVPVLLLGETGTGKEVVARAIHERSDRADKPLITVNCGAVPPNLIESTLFGHEKGAFTGANRTHTGVFEAAHGGTVFLDEIGEMPLPAQAALLRVLDTGLVTRVGSSAEVEVDVRILAATNRDLEAMVEEQTFRLDLLHRINLISLRLPPLRERLSEIIPLAQQFLRAAAEEYHRPVARLDKAVIPLLMKYHWPGNVRELRNVIERAVLIALGDAITPDDLPQPVRDAPMLRLSAGGAPPRVKMSPIGSQHSPHDEDDEDVEDEVTQSMHAVRPYKEVMAACEHALISAALRKHGGNLSQAAASLGMPRRTLAYKVKRQGITAERDLEAAQTLTRWSNATERHGSFRERLDQVEHRLLARALQTAQGDLTRAAQLLEIDRRTLISKLERRGMDWTEEIERAETES